jgi:hypothetical protein
MILSANFKPLTRSFAEVVHDLGDIPLERIRAYPPPGTATEADKNLPVNKLCELIDGALVEKPVGSPESALGVVIASLIHNHLKDKDLGLVLGEAGFFHLPHGQLRAPDVSFVPWSSFAAKRFPKTMLGGRWRRLSGLKFSVHRTLL